jgi:hypothetical protein
MKDDEAGGNQSIKDSREKNKMIVNNQRRRKPGKEGGALLIPFYGRKVCYK